jgi:hypothetical protein
MAGPVGLGESHGPALGEDVSEGVRVVRIRAGTRGGGAPPGRGSAWRRRRQCALPDLVDGDVFRTVIRRNYFLDPLSVLDDDVPMQERIERIFADLRATPRPRPGPTRDKLIEVMRTALAAWFETCGAPVG